MLIPMWKSVDDWLTLVASRLLFIAEAKKFDHSSERESEEGNISADILTDSDQADQKELNNSTRPVFANEVFFVSIALIVLLVGGAARISYF